MINNFILLNCTVFRGAYNYIIGRMGEDEYHRYKSLKWHCSGGLVNTNEKTKLEI